MRKDKKRYIGVKNETTGRYEVFFDLTSSFEEAAMRGFYKGYLPRELYLFYQESQLPQRSLPRLRHIVRHSAEGFEWGNISDGSLDLALSILTDALIPSRGVIDPYDPQIVDMYHDFCYKKIKNLPGGKWEITSKEIKRWVKKWNKSSKKTPSKT